MSLLQERAVLHFSTGEDSVIRTTSRKKLWILTLLIWIVGGGVVLHRCSVEERAIRDRAETLVRGMAARYSRSAALIRNNTDKAFIWLRIRELGRALAAYLKEVGELKKKLFWTDVFREEKVARALQELGQARKAYLEALRQRRK